MHKEYERIIPDSDTAILFIHGIAGTPNHFKDFIPLIPKDRSVCNMFLDGHGKGAEDFSHTSMKKWKAQVAAKLHQLRATHEHIIIVAHSMGTLFAIQEAIKNSTGIDALFLLASPLRLFIKPAMLITSMKVFFENIKPTDYVALAAKAAYGIKNDKRIWKYIGWIPRYLELFAEIRKTRKIVSQLAVPCYVFQSKNDEMVSLSACKVLEQSGRTHINILENSSHYYYAEKDYQFVLTEFEKLI